MRREFHVRFWEGAGVRSPRATRLVVVAHRCSERLVNWIEETLEQRMGLTINREKTRVVDMQQAGASVDFLGYTYRYNRDLRGRGHRYLSVHPSKKALARERSVLREMTSTKRCFVPIPVLIAEINRHLRGWANYFSYGYPRVAKRHINSFVRDRLTRHLRRRSQRPFRPPEGSSYYKHLQAMGLVYL